MTRNIAIAAFALLSAHAAHAQSVREHWLPGERGAHWTPRLLVREQTPPDGDRSRPVLYVHGATFPSANSMMARFRGQSWADDLNARGFDVFALDFAGYGGSERYPAMLGDDAHGAPVGRTPEAAEQVARAVALIRRETGAKRVTIIAHSWGTMPAASFTIDHPEAVDRLVLFGPILRRDGEPQGPLTDSWSLVTIEAQHARFTRDVPTGHAPVLEEADFPSWAQTYLASDPRSAGRTPPAVKTPSGPAADVSAAWSGSLAYDPGRLRRPVLVVRGEWDSSSTAADAAWFLKALPADLPRRLVTIPEATHLMHLETGRHALYAAVAAFLASEEAPGARP